MQKIDKSRKGVVFGCWRPEEQEMFRKAVDNELTPVRLANSHLWLTEIDKNILNENDIPVQHFQHYAWWIKKWDEPEGKELVGRLCRL